MSQPMPTDDIDVPVLHLKAQEFYANGLAASTKSTYSAGQLRFTTFCQRLKVPPLPATESTLILFTSYLATLTISYTTIKVYLSAIRHIHVSARMYTIFNNQLTPRLQFTLKGIQKSQAFTQPPRIRLPITLQIMGSVKTLLSNQLHSYFNIMIWAACCLALFGFLRVSKLQFQLMANTMSDATCLSTVCLLTAGTTLSN